MALRATRAQLPGSPPRRRRDPRPPSLLPSRGSSAGRRRQHLQLRCRPGVRVAPNSRRSDLVMFSHPPGTSAPPAHRASRSAHNIRLVLVDPPRPGLHRQTEAGPPPRDPTARSPRSSPRRRPRRSNGRFPPAPPPPPCDREAPRPAVPEPAASPRQRCRRVASVARRHTGCNRSCFNDRSAPVMTRASAAAPASVAITVTASIAWSASRGSSAPSLSRPPCTTSCQAVSGASAGGRAGQRRRHVRKSCGGMA
jgi:hypothetical protein